MKKNEMNNKGFSLVELIIVIAIMVILAVALAPVFTKQLERSRVASDINTASTIAECVTIAMAEGDLGTDEAATKVEAADFDSITSDPVAKTKVGDGTDFYYLIDDGVVYVYIDSDCDDQYEVYPGIGSAFLSYTN